MANFASHFDRWKPGNGQTIALRQFQAHQTSLNHLYWAHEAAKRGAFSMTKGRAKDHKAGSLFPNPTGKRKREITLEQWAREYNDFDNWTRLSAVVAVTGYLEVFVKTIIEAACQSSPGIIIGAPSAIDGLGLLKARKDYSFEEQVRPCIKDTWQKRIAAFVRLFGGCPQLVIDRCSDLDQMRQMRNAVGHAFGRTLTHPVIGRDVMPTPFQRVSEDRLVKWLDLANQTAEAIDTFLGARFVGSYELLCIYHIWHKTQNNSGRLARDFGPYLASLLGESPKLPYRRELVSFYDKC